MENHEDRGDSSPSQTTGAKMSRQQILTVIAMASINFGSMICYSILGPFFPNEAKKKGVSQAMIGLIFGIYALCTLVGSLILGKYIVQIGAKFMIVAGLFLSSGCTVLFGFLDRVSDGTVFIALCFITRSINAVGFSAAITSSFAVSAKIFPDNIATVLVSCGQLLFFNAVMLFWSKLTKEGLLHVTKDVLSLKRIVFRFSYSVCLDI